MNITNNNNYYCPKELEEMLATLQEKNKILEQRILKLEAEDYQCITQSRNIVDLNSLSKSNIKTIISKLSKNYKIRKNEDGDFELLIYTKNSPNLFCMIDSLIQNLYDNLIMISSPKIP